MATSANPSMSVCPAAVDRRFCLAPMMDCTDRHFRYFMRLITRRTLLYTEMVTTDAIEYGPCERLLAFHPAERPLALQLGGCDPKALGRCARLAEDLGFDEVNLNAGCPSERVKSGRFGACLMAEPKLVADCMTAMLEACNLAVTIKTRIGIDHRDRYEDLSEFIQAITEVGCRTVIVHARKAWLSGLSPKQNREIPPLRPETVYRLKRDFPETEIVINGGIASIEEVTSHNRRVDGSMMGREAYRNPFSLADVDRRLFREMHSKTHSIPTRREIALKMIDYAQEEIEKGTRLHSIARHILGLFHATPGARRWRRHLSTEAPRRNDPGVIEEALACARCE
ncbi:MAG: tRNA dihydrouridine(20/20a) synthase DusA [Ectothiorhodospiraceae bacterium AqS1]|nr:tRNA dihydrouridine(20/20a) synthase DusA [Ectothiorhodospiraceae bacterium AqS1]